MADGCRITPGPLLRSGQPGRSSGSKQALSGSRSGGSRSSVSGFGGGSRSSVAGYGGGGSMMMRDGPLRPPPGFVSYQIPNGVLPQPPPSDNINMYDARRFMSVGSLMSGRHIVSSAAQKQQHNGGYYPRYSRQSSGGAATDGGRTCITAREPPTTASVYPAHLHNGGRSHGSNNNGAAAEAAEREKNYWNMQRGRPRQPDVYQPPPWAGERLIDAPPMREREATAHDDADSPPSRRYPRSPMPGGRSDFALADDPRCRPPLPGAIPRPPPRSRPRSWTSTLFNAMRNGTASLSKKNGNNASSTLPPQAQGEREAEYYEEFMLEPDPYYGSQYNNSSSTPGSVGVMTGGTLDKRGGSSKQVRFLANPSKPPPDAAHPRFYSLPRFILPMGGGEGRGSGGRRSSHLLQPVGGDEKNGGSSGDAAKIKMMRSRTPSPFGRFVKSLVRGKKKKYMFRDWKNVQNCSLDKPCRQMPFLPE